MKKADVKIGGEYDTHVTGKKVVVRIDAENASGGWDATNLTTKKKVHIKSAERLQAKSARRSGRAKVATEGTATVVENEPASVETVGAAGNGTAVKPHKKRSNTTTDRNSDDERLSCVGAAVKVLSERGEPMNAKEMIDAMVAAGYWQSPGGKTPHATLYSAILRDMKKGDDSRFTKADRGKFTIR